MNVTPDPITDDDLCAMCLEEKQGRRRGEFMVLNIEERRERREFLLGVYRRENLTGPQCRACTQLPVVVR